MPPANPDRTLRRGARPAAVAAVSLSLLLTGCAQGGDSVVVEDPTGADTGTSPGPGAPGTPPATTSPSLSPAPTGEAVSADLTITVDDGAGATREWTLSCEPAGGNVPDPAAACAELSAAWPSGFTPVPPDQACTMLFGGPETATVTGTVDGQQVTAGFDRTNGCEISRWQVVEALVGPVVADPDS